MLVQSVERFFADTPQPFLEQLYRAMLSSMYFGLLRIGEVCAGPHVIKAKDVHVGKNKNKIMFVLHSSKTHCKANKLQIIKLTQVGNTPDTVVCPFKLMQEYLEIWGKYRDPSEQFFTFSDHSAVLPVQLRAIVKKLIKFNHLDPQQYTVHGIRGGWASDLLDAGVSIETIKKLGRWKSSAVFTYLQT